MTALRDCERMEYPQLAERVSALAKGLSRVGLAGYGDMLVVTCTGHSADRAVAVSAAERTGLSVSCLDPDEVGLHAALRARPTVVLACHEGSAAVAASQLPCRIFGDRPGMAWWRSLELLHRLSE
ncbi:hypothetical protein GCM10009676_39000 [Prauserella halophila]|uniref:Uncharacterized protein n=1 Tax=Prauserella halophila TaxID=185641 RepID=A0ABN1WFQ2_9PSEU|nr:hypothetical protein [Prauserella halophila]MCP2238169.1 AMP-binding enzyme [Prauserella halophila]